MKNVNSRVSEPFPHRVRQGNNMLLYILRNVQLGVTYVV